MSNDIDVLRVKISKKRKQKIITIMFCILPLIDTLNGIYSEIPVGKMYKMSLGLMVFLYLCLKQRKMKKNYTMIMGGAIIYVIFSIIINILLGDIPLSIDYPLKLIFNIVLLISLLQCADYKLLNGIDFYHILDISSWLFIGCYFIPYILGIGNRVYAGDIGYKAFFIAQNELGLIVVVFCFFNAYQLTNRIKTLYVLKLVLLLACGLLLNTKTAIIGSLISIIMWFGHIVIKGKTKYKVMSIIAVIIGVFTLKNTIINSFVLVQQRYSMLTTKYYKGSIITGLLSARNNTFFSALNNLLHNHFIIRFFIGNGFCSELLTEMDIVDVFFYLGFIGAFFTIAVLFRLFIVTIRNSKTDSSRIRLASYLIIVALLFWAGHVLFMAMSGCYFIIYLCFLIYYKELD